METKSRRAKAEQMAQATKEQAGITFKVDLLKLHQIYFCTQFTPITHISVELMNAISNLRCFDLSLRRILICLVCVLAD